MSPAICSCFAPRIEVRPCEPQAIAGTCQGVTSSRPVITAAIVHDRSSSAVTLARIYREALPRAPGMAALLSEALDAFAPAFDADDHASGADLVEWFAFWRRRVAEVLDTPVLRQLQCSCVQSGCGV